LNETVCPQYFVSTILILELFYRHFRQTIPSQLQLELLNGKHLFLRSLI
jgi:hypothetical protein